MQNQLANLITLSRLLLMLLVIVLVLKPPAAWQLFVAIPLTIMVFVSDALDGYVARRFQQTSKLGAVLDIAVDRTVEICFWIVFAAMGLIPVWIPLLFVIRGVLVDAIRAEGGKSGQAPFDIMRSALGRWLVAGHFIRAFYAVIKTTAFCLLILVYALPSLFGAGQWFPAAQLAPATSVAWWLAWLAIGLSVFLCIVRGLPVIAEFIHQQSQTPADSKPATAASQKTPR